MNPVKNRFGKRFRERLVPCLSGAAGSFLLVRGVLELFYDGRWINFWVCLLCAEVWAFVWSSLEELPYLLCVLMFMAAPLIHIHPDWTSICLLLFSFVCLRGQGQRSRYVIGGAVFVLVLSLSGAAAHAGGGALSESSFWIDRCLHRLYVSLFGESEEMTFENGNVGRGNNYRSGSAQLDILTNRAPEEDLYLRGYVGAEYTGSRWTEADEASFYQRAAELTRRDNQMGQLEMVHQNLYFMLRHGNMSNWVYLLEGNFHTTSPSGPRQLAVHVRNVSARRYLPYFAFYAANAEYGQDADYYYYYEPPQMYSEQNARTLAHMPSSTKLLLREYEDYVEEVYLEAPVRRVPRLEELCRENQLTDPEEITDFIRETLQAETSYTRTPGTTPVNQDVIEYFLFENKRGYCMHYASAAVLMYRMYGIPARYVTGYVVYPSDFEPQTDGSYAAVVTDYRKHAWVEIYQKDVGWTPVEMTPLERVPQGESASGWFLPEYGSFAGGDGAGEGTGAGIGGISLSAGEEEEEEEEEDEGGEDEEEDGQEESGGDEEEAENAKGRGKLSGKGLLWAACGVPLFLLAIASLWYRRRRNLKALEEMDARRLFYRLLRQLHAAGRLKGYTGAEKDFTEKLCMEFPLLEEEEVRAFMETVNRAAYGEQDQPQPSVYAFYSKASAELYRHMGRLQRFYFRGQ